MSLQSEINNYVAVCENLKGLSKLTIKAYKIDLKQYQEYANDLDWLSKECMTTYIDHLYKAYSPKSAKRKIACLKAFYRYLEMEDIIEYNPFHKIKIKYKEPIVLPKTISLNDIKTILVFSYNKKEDGKTVVQRKTRLRDVLILEMLFSTGMRVSEISHLSVDDINLIDGTIRIFGKGSKERIMCLTNESVLKLLAEYINTQNKASSYMFTNRLGNRLSEQSIRNMVNNYACAAGVTQHITPHMFRHTFATALHDEDVDIRYIQQLLGHSSISTTQIYTHISTNKIHKLLEEKHPRNKIIL